MHDSQLMTTDADRDQFLCFPGQRAIAECSLLKSKEGFVDFGVECQQLGVRLLTAPCDVFELIHRYPPNSLAEIDGRAVPGVGQCHSREARNYDYMRLRRRRSRSTESEAERPALEVMTSQAIAWTARLTKR